MTFVRRAALLALSCALSPALAAPALAQTAPVAVADAAPADEYFGPLHLSVLGIGNALRLATQRERADGSLDATPALAMIETSLHDWESQFPRDPWLSRTVFALRGAYVACGAPAAVGHARAVEAWLVARYPGSAEVAALREEFLAQRAPDPVESLYVAPPAPAVAPAQYAAVPSYAEPPIPSYAERER